MEYKDYYKILGVERGATQDDIKRAFRKLARKYHPDVNKQEGAEAKFKEIGEANDVLSDPEKRAAYDQLGKDWQAGQEFRPPPGWDAGFEYSGASPGAAPGGAGGGDFSDFFESLFGRARRPGASGGGAGAWQAQAGTHEFHARGEDHHAKVLIDLADSFAGAARQISLRVPELDPEGHVRVRDRALSVQIPKGILEGQHIRLKGQGGPGHGRRPAGDLYLEVQFKSDPLYRVDGKNLYVELPVAPWEAALGASVKMPTPVGSIMLKVPAGSAPGRELRIKGRGIPAPEPGDLYAVLKIVLPPAGDSSGRSAYEAFARAFPGYDPRAKFGGAS